MSLPLRPLTTVAAAASLALSPLALAACGDDATEQEQTSTSIGEGSAEDQGFDYTEGDREPAYEGAYDTRFRDVIDEFLGEDVVVSASVEAVSSPVAFTIAGFDDVGLPPLLVLAPQGAEGVEEGMELEVSGTVQGTFSPSTAEEDLGVDLDDDALAEFEGEPYLLAEAVGQVVGTG
ncbi:hypothetical protein ACI792_15435 [Blastococcus sp. SYSU DS0669]